MNVLLAFEEIKQGNIVQDEKTLDRFKYITDDHTGELMLYHYSKHYGYIIEHDEFLNEFNNCSFNLISGEDEKNWN